MTVRKVGRHAGSGKFIPVGKAVKLGSRAVVETIKYPTTR